MLFLEMRLEVEIRKHGDDRYKGRIPALPGLEAIGASKEEVLARLKAAAREWFMREAAAEESGVDANAFDPLDSRLHAQGIRRDQLAEALRDRALVQRHVSLDRCLLCTSPHVNAASLCPVCAAAVDGEEARLMERWESGFGF